MVLLPEKETSLREPILGTSAGGLPAASKRSLRNLALFEFRTKGAL